MDESHLGLFHETAFKHLDVAGFNISHHGGSVKQYFHELFSAIVSGKEKAGGQKKVVYVLFNGLNH